MDQKVNVFVYGTLRKHERNHGLLQDAVCISAQCWTPGKLVDTGSGYPAMVEDACGMVYGELYEVTGEQLKELDWLEGYTGEAGTNHYDRIIQTVHTDRGVYEAYVYMYSKENAAGLKQVSFGDWKCHTKLKSGELLYFAYGSCMDDGRFRQAGVDDFFRDVIGAGRVEGFELAFTRKAVDGGRADMVEADAHVEGKVYRIPPEALRYLYRREGVNAGIYRPAFVDVEVGGVLHEDMLTFLVIDKEPETAPPEHYAIEILRGAKGFVSEGYYEELKMKMPMD